MAALRAIYARSLTPGGMLIRAAQWFDPWSHCGIVTPQNTVIDAEAWRGVIEEPMPSFLARYSTTEIVDIECPNPDAGMAWARSVIGAGYDYWALVRMISGHLGMRHRPGTYDCTAVLEHAVVAAGRERFRTDIFYLTPTQSYKVK